MLKLQTEVKIEKSHVKISYDDKIMILGSCFSGNIGTKMQELDFKVSVNPFGCLYNPISIYNSIERLQSGIAFDENDCVEMGAGANLICSFYHHSSFARKTKYLFLENANRELDRASRFWKSSNLCIITFGTAWHYIHQRNNKTVSNCLKRDQKEFIRQRVSYDEVYSLFKQILDNNQSKKFIFTVSPIRHLKDGAHENNLSKSTLILAIEKICQNYIGRAAYFPAYEIMLDELRDYRFYDEDMIHPSKQAVNYIWKRFCDFSLNESEQEMLLIKEKSLKQSQHIPLLNN